MLLGETHYVVGLAFDAAREYVVLIRKDHPAWQAGKLNGVGGKIEDGESPRQAMAREFHEEAGVHIPPISWSRVARMQGVDEEGWSWDVAVFTVATDQAFEARTQTSEEIVLLRPPARWGSIEYVSNLRWLIPLAADPERPFVTADYSDVPNAQKAASQDREHHEEET